jgi:hypothetical protein
MARARYKLDPAPRRVTQGSVSKPKSKGAAFRGSRLVADATPYRVKQGGTGY